MKLDFDRKLEEANDTIARKLNEMEKCLVEIQNCLAQSTMVINDLQLSRANLSPIMKRFGPVLMAPMRKRKKRAVNDEGS